MLFCFSRSSYCSANCFVLCISIWTKGFLSKLLNSFDSTLTVWGSHFVDCQVSLLNCLDSWKYLDLFHDVSASLNYLRLCHHVSSPNVWLKKHPKVMYNVAQTVVQVYLSCIVGIQIKATPSKLDIGLGCACVCVCARVCITQLMTWSISDAITLHAKTSDCKLILLCSNIDWYLRRCISIYEQVLMCPHMSCSFIEAGFLIFNFKFFVGGDALCLKLKSR